MTFETENIEFKLQFTDELYKEVIAFARIGQYLIIPFFFLGELAAFFFIK